MGEKGRRLGGLTVTASALAGVLTLAASPSDRAAPSPDFGPAVPARASGPAEHPGPTATDPDPGHRSERPLPPPRRVLVRDVGLDAPVRPVGVTGQGTLAVPSNPTVAGWYRFGPAPGSSRGSAVLVGHVDSDSGTLGEFAALSGVRPGDRVEVHRAEAAPAVYRIVARTTVPKGDLPSSVFRRTGSPVLTLITCAPPFVPDRGGYLANVVVTAEPVRE
ncbi:class F sortase [Streptomyces sp. NEAU-W12]|uniref:class F sortase n=1 Tax=Streptomyces sp. NEAU-W12 TaxID=2994668 RepID=UPI00224A8E41|nr:class F sortase [Streptomyces sp. NEAU-W12]MCX2924070.1 class F sortase [Streptomyces sp. NEAU-W12]